MYGEYRHTLDAKNRLFIPAKHREELGESFMIARSIRDNCLKVYSMPEWDKYIEPILKMDRKDSEVILRTLHRNAAQVSPDAQGRIVIPPVLKAYANIEKELVTMGAMSKIEVWSKEVWDSPDNDSKMETEDFANALTEYNF